MSTLRTALPRTYHKHFTTIWWKRFRFVTKSGLFSPAHAGRASANTCTGNRAALLLPRESVPSGPAISARGEGLPIAFRLLPAERSSRPLNFCAGDRGTSPAPQLAGPTAQRGGGAEGRAVWPAHSRVGYEAGAGWSSHWNPPSPGASGESQTSPVRARSVPRLRGRGAAALVALLPFEDRTHYELSRPLQTASAPFRGILGRKLPLVRFSSVALAASWEAPRARPYRPFSPLFHATPPTSISKPGPTRRGTRTGRQMVRSPYPVPSVSC